MSKKVGFFSKMNRRHFLQSAALGIGTVTISRILPGTIRRQGDEDASQGELYEGFVLLDINSPMPLFVNQPPAPILGDVEKGLENDPRVIAIRGKSEKHKTIQSLKGSINNLPIFIPNDLPNGIVYIDGTVIRFEKSSELWEARLDFGYEDNSDPLISCSTRPIFSKPYPVWPVIFFPDKVPGQLVEDQEFVIKKPEKIDFTPNKGIKINTSTGYLMQWIKDNLLHTLSITYQGWIDIPESVGKSIVLF